MVNEKDLELLRFLQDETENGRIKWQATALENEFASSLRGKYVLTMSRMGTITRLRLTDQNERELLTINSFEAERVEELFEYVRRRALDVDGAIDDILKGQWRNLSS